MTRKPAHLPHYYYDLFEKNTGVKYKGKMTGDDMKAIKINYHDNTKENFLEKKGTSNEQKFANVIATSAVATGIAGAVMLYRSLSDPSNVSDMLYDAGTSGVFYGLSSIQVRISNAFRKDSKRRGVSDNKNSEAKVFIHLGKDDDSVEVAKKMQEYGITRIREYGDRCKGIEGRLLYDSKEYLTLLDSIQKKVGVASLSITPRS